MALDSFTPCFQATFLALLDVDCLDGSAALLLNNYVSSSIGGAHEHEDY